MSFLLKNVKCENTANPLGIGTTSPEFAWQLESDEVGAFQTAYRISVSNENGEILLDTGKVLSSKQFGIKLDLNKKIKPFSKYFYEITAWNNKDEQTESYKSFFLTGVFKAVEWRGEWFKIRDEFGSCFGKVAYTRKEFDLYNENVTEAYCFIGAVGEKANAVASYINGKRVGEEPMFPGATEYFRAFYTAIDVTDLLKKGRNTVGMLISKCASLVLMIKYESGKVQFIESKKKEWKYTDEGGYYLGYQTPMMYHGKVETFDRTKHHEGFSENGFDDSMWEHYRDPYDVIDFGPLFVTAQYCKTITEAPIKAQSIEYFEDRILVDFGVNMSGFATFKLKGKKGQTIKLCYTERVLEDRHAVLANCYSYCEYTFSGDEIEFYRPEFLTTGFCAVEIYGYEGKINCEDALAYFVHSNVETETSFSSSDSSLNKLSTIARRSFLSNLVNFPTDCPERERRGWTADAYAVSEAECIHFDLVNLYRQWFISYKDCQRQSGWLPVELPLSTDESIDLNWPVSVILVPYDILKQYGDIEFCKTNYSSMRLYAELMLELADDEYNLSPSFYSYKDWQTDWGCTPVYLGMAYLYRALSCISEIAEAIGESEDSVRYSAIAKDVKKNINARYYKNASYDNGTQSANAHALYFGICEEENKKAVTETLARSIETDGRNTTGFMGTACILQALSQNGRFDAAYKLLKSPERGGWIWLVETFKATTFPEKYHGDCVSQNHAFLGSAPGLWCFKYLCGITPLEYGYKKIGIAPCLPDDITSLDTTVSTPYGEVILKLKKGEKVTAEVTIPVSTTAVFTYNGKSFDLVSGKHTIEV